MNAIGKATLSNILFARNRRILEILPDTPADTLDAFIFEFIDRLATANLGMGFDAIQAKVKLECIRSMSYAQIRAAAIQSPDYVNFERERYVSCEADPVST